MVLEDYKSYKVGLALGDGAALGAAHVGVLRAFEEFNIQIDYVAGTSIGAMVGLFMLLGCRWIKRESRKRAVQLDLLLLSSSFF